MNTTRRKIAVASMLQLSLLMMLLYFGTIANAAQQPTIRIVEATTGSSSLNLGGAATDMPTEGYDFTVNVVLEGNAPDLFLYQITVKYDQSMVRCTGIWINILDSDFVFHDYVDEVLLPPSPIVDPVMGYATTGASLLSTMDSDTDGGLLCQLNFTAFKLGTSNLDFILKEEPSTDHTFLQKVETNNMIPFDSYGMSITVNGKSTAPPVAAFSFYPENPKVQQDVVFNAAASYVSAGNIVNYAWNFDDGTTMTTVADSVVHAFSESGAYDVALTVFDDKGLNGSTSQMVQVGKPPFASFAHTPKNPKSDETVTFDASGSFDYDGAITGYVWDFGDGKTETAADAVATHVYGKNGVYNVELKVYDNDGLYDASTQAVLVGIAPVADFTFLPENPDPDEEIIFNAYGNDIQRVSYDPDGQIVRAVWDFGDYKIVECDLSNPEQMIVSHTYKVQGGLYPVNLTVFDDDGLYTSVVHAVNVTSVNLAEAPRMWWEGYASAGATVGALVTAATVWYKKKPDEEAEKDKKYRVF